MEALTVPALWRGFDPTIGEFDNRIIRQTERGGYRVSEMYFSSSPLKANKFARIFAEYYQPENNSDAPLIIIFDDFLHDLNFDLPHLMTGDFAVLRIDYSGESDEKERFTIFPRELSQYCNILRYPDAINKVPSELTLSCKYIQTAIALRTLAFAEYVLGYDLSKVATIGIEEGAGIAFRLCALKHIGAGVGLYGEALLDSENVNANDLLSYRSALEVSAYARFLETPFLEQITSNSSNDNLDYISDMMFAVTQPDSRLSIMERANRYLAPKQRKNVPQFLRYHLLGEGQRIPDSPQIAVQPSENKLFFQINYDSSAEVESCELFVSQGMTRSTYRNWSCVPMTAMGATLLGKVAVFDVSKPVYAFVNVKYKGYLSLSSPVLRLNPSALGIKADEFTPSRLVYDSDMGLDDWLVLNDRDVDETVKLDMLKGPYDIEGVCSKTYSLATFKLGDPRYIGFEGRTLQIRLYSEVHQQLEFIIKQKTSDESSEDFKTFSCLRTVGPFDDWATLNFNAADFKSVLGTLDGWSEIAMLEIAARGGDAGYGKVLVKTIIWL